MITNISPIRTRVAGTIYRSRLEAKWAVFFTALAVTFKYHSRNLIPTLWASLYVPTFLLEREQVYVEIAELSSADDQPRFSEFADDSGFPLLYIRGEPKPDKYAISLYPPKHNRRLYEEISSAQFAEGANEPKRLWLRQDTRFFRIAKIWNQQQLKGSKPLADSKWLRTAYAHALTAETEWMSFD